MLDQAIAHATGVFWRQDASKFTMTGAYIQRGDGAGCTFMLSENIDAGFWADISLTGGTPNRRDLQTPYIAFGIPVSIPVPAPAAFAQLITGGHVWNVSEREQQLSRDAIANDEPYRELGHDR